uniref:Cytochrome b561 and DOMON domain-containing protein n=1 Tax=Leersia perrieri TaxID=77586 RepID=A0A0D9V8X5_9ORYZ
MTRITMKHWHPLLLPLLLLCFVISSSSQSTSSDSCTTALSLGDLIPFNTTGLSCFQAWTSQDFILRFGKDSSSKNVWSFVLSAPDSGGYIAVGFAPTAGRMVGSSAVAGWVDTSSSGAGTARQYYLGGTSSSSCPPDKGNLALSSATASSPAIVSKGSRLYLAFQLTGQPITDVIYAVGPSGSLPSSNGFLPRHLDMTSGTITLSGGGGGSTSTGGGGGGDDDDNGGGEGKGNNKHKHSGGGDGDGDEGGKGDRRNSPSSSSSSTASSNGGGLNAKRRHGVLAAISWGITIPIGVAAARFMKSHDPLWFYLHATIQGLGFVVGAVAIVAGFRLDDDDGADAHKGIGIAVLVGGCLQVMAVLARPVKEAKARRYWNWYHHYVGRAAVVLGAGNVLYGLSLAKEGEGWSYVYGIFVGVCAVVYLVLEEWRRRH